MRFLAFILFVIFGSVTSAKDDPFDVTLYGSFLHTGQVPNALFFFNDIVQYDSFQLRRALRDHEIDTVVLASEGGNVLEGLVMAGIIHDQGIFTYVPEMPDRIGCYSACSYMFFGGKIRKADGILAVHQAGTYGLEIDQSNQQIGETQQQTQYTVSEIIGFLNEFETPPFVYEKMFRSREFHEFTNEEKVKLEAGNHEISNDNVTKINDFLSSFYSYLMERKSKSLVSDEAEIPQTKPDLVEHTPPQTDTVGTDAAVISEKELIRKIQVRLSEIGCNPGPIDGIWGRKTQNAASVFAKSSKLKSSQIPDYKSADFLEILKNVDTNSCPKPAKQSKKQKYPITEIWKGYEYCTVIDGKRNKTITIQHTDEKTFFINFNYVALSGANQTIRFNAPTGDKNGSYNFKIGSMKFKLNVDFNNGLITGRASETNLWVRGAMAALLMSGYCDVRFVR